MSRKLGLYCVAAATALMTFAVADEAQAWGRRGGGSSGSDGGYSSHGGNGSFGSFGGRGRRRGRGSWGSNGSFGSYGSNGGYNNGSHGGHNNGCGNQDERNNGCDSGCDAGCDSCTGGGELVYGEVHENGEPSPVEHEAQYHERSDTMHDRHEARDADQKVEHGAEQATQPAEANTRLNQPQGPPEARGQGDQPPLSEPNQPRS